MPFRLVLLAAGVLLTAVPAPALAQSGGAAAPDSGAGGHVFEQPAATALDQIEKRYPVQRMRELERLQREEREQLENERLDRDRPKFFVLAAVFRDESAARAKLQELLDAGFDATIVSAEQDGQVVLEVRVGPYETQYRAEVAAETLRQAHGLSPTVLRLEGATP